LTGYQIRRAQPKDEKAISGCIVAAYKPVLARGLELPPVSEGVATDIRDNTVWLAEDGNEVLGGLIVTTEDQVLHIANLFVKPSAQGRGLAGALMSLACDYAKEQHCEVMRLATHKDMPENVALYAHLGWVACATEGNKVLMSKPVLSGRG